VVLGSEIGALLLRIGSLITVERRN